MEDEETQKKELVVSAAPRTPIAACLPFLSFITIKDMPQTVGKRRFI